MEAVNIENEMKEKVGQLYSSFNECDLEGMLSVYHEEAKFFDPVFGNLNRKEIEGMWGMLLSRQSPDALAIEYGDIKIDGDVALVEWQAKYEFSKTKRKVHNRINAQLHFKDGLIINHKDDFNLHKWAGQALGWKGIFFGGFSFFKKGIKKQSKSLLNSYLKKQ